MAGNVFQPHATGIAHSLCWAGVRPVVESGGVSLDLREYGCNGSLCERVGDVGVLNIVGHRSYF